MEYPVSRLWKKVIKERQNFIMMLNNLIGEIHSKLTSGKEKLEIIYDKNVSEDEFEKVLADKVHVDLNYMSTQTGPHRDDIMFMINGIDARRFGSQGQQRTVALSLKIAEIKLVKNIIMIIRYCFWTMLCQSLTAAEEKLC